MRRLMWLVSISMVVIIALVACAGETVVRLRQLVCKQDQAATFSVIVFMTIPSSYLAPW